MVLTRRGRTQQRQQHQERLKRNRNDEPAVVTDDEQSDDCSMPLPTGAQSRDHPPTMIPDPNNNSNHPQHGVASAGTTNLRQIGLLACLATGICSCYLCYGIVQERLFSKSSPHGEAVRRVGPITTFLVMTQCVGNTAVALLWTWVQRNVMRAVAVSRESEGSSAKKKTSGGVVVLARGRPTAESAPPATTAVATQVLNHKLLLLTAFCYFGAMACSNESINHVSYPTVVLAKSSKLIPAMVAGVLIERRSYTTREWVGAALITSGIIIFNWTRMSAQNGDGEEGDGDSPFGLLLLLTSLAMDGALSACQGGLKRSTGQYRPPTAMEFMMYTNTYSFFFLLPASAWSGQLHNGTTLFLQSGADAAAARRWIYLLNATAAAGQVFIFLTIHCFSSLMCTTITTTRKFFSILLSVRHFGHVFSNLQWSSIAMVFSGLYMEIAAKLNRGGTAAQAQEKKKA